MTTTHRILSGLAFLTVLGTVGYVLVEEYGWVDALDMTVITLSTVGYGEVESLSVPGQLFSVFLIATGVGAALYLLSAAQRAQSPSSTP